MADLVDTPPLHGRVVEIRYEAYHYKWYGCGESTDKTFNRYFDKLLFQEDDPLNVFSRYVMLGEERALEFTGNDAMDGHKTWIPAEMYSRPCYFAYDIDTLYFGTEEGGNMKEGITTLSQILDLSKVTRLYYDYHRASDDLCEDGNWGTVRTDWDLLQYFTALEELVIAVDHASWEMNIKQSGIVTLGPFPGDLAYESRMRDWTENAEEMRDALQKRWGSKAPKKFTFGHVYRGGVSTRGTDI